MQAIDQHILKLIRSANSIAVLTGAGVSAESGIPTFRDAMTGYWAKFDPAELATPEAFGRNPEMVARWYDERRCQVARCRPNAGHVALAELQRLKLAQGKQFTLITQNVDRLHQRAGSSDVIELHGSLWVWRCLDCGAEAEEVGGAFDEFPPRCGCGGKRRPGVVWFGEELPADALLKAQRAAASSEMFLSLGTSAVVYPAAGLIDLALARGSRVLEINPEETTYSRKVDWSIRGKCGEELPAMVKGVVG